MKHYKQEHGYCCGIYSIANALQNDKIINEENILLSKNGNNQLQLNKMLIDLGYDWGLSYISYNNEKIIEIFDLEPKFEKDTLWIPFFIVIQSTMDKNHMIGCRYMKDGSIIVHDSLRDNPDLYDNFNDFKNKYDGMILSYELLRNFENKLIIMKDL